MIHQFKIVMLGQDQTLLDTRAWVLQRAGYDAQTAINLEKIAVVKSAGVTDLLILCYTLSPDQVSAAIEFAHADEQSIRQLLLLSGRDMSTFESHYPTLNSFSGPQALIETVRGLLQ